MKKLLSVILIGLMVVFSYSMNNTKMKDRMGNMHKGTDRSNMKMMQFSDLDTDGDGMISPAEFETHRNKMKEKMKQMMSKNKMKIPKMPKAMLDRFDTDKDGKLSKDEKESLFKYMKTTAKEMKEKINSMFDKDGNGRIEGDEREALKEYFEKEKKDFEAKYDVNKDGKISPDEIDNVPFEDLPKMGPMLMQNRRGNMNKRPEGRPGMLPKAVKERFDTDKDGKLSKDEAKELQTYMMEKSKKMKVKIHNMFDKDGNGKIDENERVALKEYFEKQKKDFEEKYDVNEDGKITPDEMDNVTFEDCQNMGPIFMNRRNKRPDMRKRENMENDKSFMKGMKERFMKKNKDSGYGKKGKDTIVKKYYLQRFDTNKNGKIDKDERIQITEEIKKLKNRYDIDGDGKLSREEAKKMYDTLEKMAKEYLRITE